MRHPCGPYAPYELVLHPTREASHAVPGAAARTHRCWGEGMAVPSLPRRLAIPSKERAEIFWLGPETRAN